MNQNGQQDLPDAFTVPAPLVQATFQLLGQLNAASAAETYMQWADLINEQVEACRTPAKTARPAKAISR